MIAIWPWSSTWRLVACALDRRRHIRPFYAVDLVFAAAISIIPIVVAVIWTNSSHPLCAANTQLSREHSNQLTTMHNYGLVRRLEDERKDILLTNWIFCFRIRFLRCGDA
jgi:hypothetical protein